MEAPNDQRFKEWTVVSGGAVLDEATSATTTFAMPAEEVEVTATYEAKPDLSGTRPWKTSQGDSIPKDS